MTYADNSKQTLISARIVLEAINGLVTSRFVTPTSGFAHCFGRVMHRLERVA
jgi:hypothetical protein